MQYQGRVVQATSIKEDHLSTTCTFCSLILYLSMNDDVVTMNSGWASGLNHKMGSFRIVILLEVPLFEVWKLVLLENQIT